MSANRILIEEKLRNKKLLGLISESEYKIESKHGAHNFLYEEEEILQENYHDTDWIPALESTFNASVKVDKEEKVKPPYGGGSFVFIGYEATLNKPQGEMSGFILEGLQFNGRFVTAGVIIKINGQYQIHSNLMLTFSHIDSFEKNLKHVISALHEKTLKYMNEQKKSLSEDSTLDISHFTQIESPEHLDRLISQGVVGSQWEGSEVSKKSVNFVRIPKREDELNMSVEEYEDANYDEFYDNQYNGAGRWSYKQTLDEVIDAGDEWGLKIVLTATLDV